jgi:tripartite-type tricarboxylate transporter receptor subunit TctC
VRILTVLLAWIITLLATFNLALAAPYPTRYLTLIVPVPVGGAGDFVGRLVAERLSNALGERVIVDNRGGASGTIAAMAVARAAPDGYTLLLSSSTTHATAPAAFKALPYDPIKDFIHFGLIATAPAVLSINAALPPKSLAEFVDYAKRNPDQLNYGSSGVGAPGQFWGEMFKTASNVVWSTCLTKAQLRPCSTSSRDRFMLSSTDFRRSFPTFGPVRSDLWRR